MKKFFSFAIVSALLFSTLFGCSKGENGDVKNLPNAKLGVIETTGYKNKSYIHFLDEDLKPVYTEVYRHGSLPAGFQLPVYQDGYMYASPQGMDQIRKEEFILKYNCKDGSYEELDTGLFSMNEIAVNDKYVYGVNTVNDKSTITRCDINTGEKVSTDLQGVYVRDMRAFGDYLYVLGQETDLYSARSYLFVFTLDNLEEVERFDITQYGNPLRLMGHENKVYIAIQNKTHEDRIHYSNIQTVAVFDIATKTFNTIETGVDCPYNLYIRDDILYASHYDPVTNEGDKITATNLITGENKIYTFGHDVRQMAIVGDDLYILGDNVMYKYKFENGEYVLLGQENMEKDQSKTFFYVPSFFICS